jgi:putative lipoic acid-binding regulatory protein
MDKETLSFKAALDQHYRWPCEYQFKFIVKSDKVAELLSLFGDRKIISKESAKGRYTSITFSAFLNSSDDVISIYNQAATVPGTLAL